MRTTTRLLTSTGVAAGILAVGAGGALAADTSGTSISGTQVVTKGCQKTTVQVTTTVKGMTADKGGKDHVQFQIWDDRKVKAKYDMYVAVGQSKKATVVLSFSGLYAKKARGVGVVVVDVESKKMLFRKDPFVPANGKGTCDASAKPTASESSADQPSGPPVETDMVGEGGANAGALAAGSLALLGATGAGVAARRRLKG